MSVSQYLLNTSCVHARVLPQPWTRYLGGEDGVEGTWVERMLWKDHRHESLALSSH